jgi:heptosyltransferase-3
MGSQHLADRERFVTQRILFIAPTRIGDAVLSTALLEYIRETQPQAKITLIASPFSAALFEGNPQIELLHIVDKQRHSRHWLRIMRHAWRHRWHAVWDMRGSVLAYFCVTRRRYIFSSTKHPMPKCEQYRLKLQLPPLPIPKLWPRAEDETIAAHIIAPHDRVIAFAPCANWLKKEWPIENFVALATRMFEGKFRDYRPLILCAEHERSRALPLLEALHAFHPIDATTGQYHLLTIYACLGRCIGFIGNDSGLMHMAAASGTSTIGLFGATDAVTYQPVGKHAAYLVAAYGNLSNLSPLMVMDFILDSVDVH